LCGAGLFAAGEEVTAAGGRVGQPGFGVGQVLLDLAAFGVQFLQAGGVLLEGGLVGQEGAQGADVGTQLL
jgi:hypothetical protein